jgi:MFS family permease
MPVDYLAVAHAGARPLLGCALLLMLSSAGQTFFVALTGAAMREAFAVSDGVLGGAFAAATLASGLVLGRAGRALDRLPLRSGAALVTAGLAASCVLVALAPSLVVLTVAFFLLRLTGQGLLVHTAMTATARSFAGDRGKALGLVALGLTVGEGLLPPLVVALLGLLDWRQLWWLTAAMVLLLGLPTLRLLPIAVASAGGTDAAAARAAAKDVPWGDRRFLLALPAILSPPFIVTGLFFHQVRLAAERGWPLEVVAGGFVLFAAVRAVALLGVGPVIDRIGAARLLPWFLMPQAFAMLAIIVGHGEAGMALAYLAMTGITGGVAGTMVTALWADLFGLARLGTVRAAVAGMAVIASALGPVVMGMLIDLGIALSVQAAFCLIVLLAASAATVPVAAAPRNP